MAKWMDENRWGLFFSPWLPEEKGVVSERFREDSPISISFMGGQRSHQDSQDGPQYPWHPMEVVDTTRVLNFEFGFEDRLEDRMDNRLRKSTYTYPGPGGEVAQGLEIPCPWSRLLPSHALFRS